MPQTPPRLRSVLLGFFGLLGLFAALETVTRLWLASPAPPRAYTPYGWVESPGSRIVHSVEGYSRSRLNSYGFDDDEPDTTAPVTALLLGDSYGQSRQVSREKGFPRLAETLVQGLEVVNASRSGFSPLDYGAYAPPLAAMFHPDVILLTVTDGDVDNLLASGLADRDAAEAIRAHRERDSRLAAERSGPLLWAERLVRSSALATFAFHRATLLAGRESERLHEKLASAEAEAAPAREGEGTDAPVPEELDRLLDGIYREIRAVGPSVAVLYIPNMVYDADGCTNKWPHRRAFYRRFALRNGAPFVDLSDRIQEEYLRTGQPLHGFENSRIGSGHINARGHRIAGRAAAELVVEALR